MSLDDLMTLIAMPLINEAFGAAVRRELDARGLSLRQARIRTGLDIDTLGRMRSGEVTRMDKVIAFARGFHLDVNEWLALAGYAPVEPSVEQAVQKLAETAELTYESEEQVQLRGAWGHVPRAARERLAQILLERDAEGGDTT